MAVWSCSRQLKVTTGSPLPSADSAWPPPSWSPARRSALTLPARRTPPKPAAESQTRKAKCLQTRMENPKTIKQQSWSGESVTHFPSFDGSLLETLTTSLTEEEKLRYDARKMNVWPVASSFLSHRRTAAIILRHPGLLLANCLISADVKVPAQSEDVYFSRSSHPLEMFLQRDACLDPHPLRVDDAFVFPGHAARPLPGLLIQTVALCRSALRLQLHHL